MDDVTLAALLSSRLCHDLSGPVGAIGNGVEMLDGETDPHPMRGIGGEDIFNMSFGVWEAQAPWVGTPHLKEPVKGAAGRAGYECVNYRFFGPDPIWFNTSSVVRFGSKANDIETVIYAYVHAQPAPSLLTPDTWLLAGPVRCNNESAFARREWAEEPIHLWPETWTPGFGQYVTDQGHAAFGIPIQADSEHGWWILPVIFGVENRLTSVRSRWMYQPMLWARSM